MSDKIITHVTENGDVKKDYISFFRTPYNYDMNVASDASGLHCKDPTLAQQQFKEESDINEIMRRFGITGEMPQSFTMPTSQDYSNTVNDYQTALNIIREADESFAELPPEIRAEFRNDPQELLAFLEDDKNLAEGIRRGLINKPPETPPEAPTPPVESTTPK